MAFINFNKLQKSLMSMLKLKKLYVNILLLILLIVIIYFIFNNFFQLRMPLFSNFKLIESMDNNSSNKPKIVYYYSESCKYCKEFTPIWESFKSEFNKSNIKDNFTIEKIEASNINESTMTNLDIKGYPTVLIVNNNEKIAEFDLERTPEKLMEFAENNSS